MFAPANARQFPRLKGKAAEVRCFGPALAAAFAEFCAPDDPQHRQIKLALNLMENVESILDFHKDEFRLPPAAAQDLKMSLFAWVQVNATLGHYYHNRNTLLFHFTVKFHYMCHIGLVAQYINPRWGWCYSGEDFMLRIKLLVQGSQRAVKPAKLVSKVMGKYVIGAGLRMQDTMWRM